MAHTPTYLKHNPFGGIYSDKRHNTPTKIKIKIKIGKMEADVSGGWTNSCHDMFFFPPLCVSPTEDSALPYMDAPWFTQRRSGEEREEKRPFCLELLFKGATKLSAIMEMAVLWSVRTSGMISRMSVMYSRSFRDLRLLNPAAATKSMIWYEVLEYTNCTMLIIDCICTANW